MRLFAKHKIIGKSFILECSFNYIHPYLETWERDQTEEANFLSLNLFHSFVATDCKIRSIIEGANLTSSVHASS